MRNNDFGYFAGCLMGGAVGDALGAPVEKMNYEEIIKTFGPKGIEKFEEFCGRKGAFTDDTQMSLFTAEGLVISSTRARGDISAIPDFLYQAYLRWYSTQMTSEKESLIGSYGTCIIVDGILTGFQELHALRGPGRTCLESLTGGIKGTIENPVNNSKGCGGVMRVAPVGLFLKPDKAFRVGCQSAAITHGHPSGYLAAGCLAHIISDIIYKDSDIRPAVESSMKILETHPNHEECLCAIQKALDLADKGVEPPQTVKTLGEGWIAQEALSIGIYCALIGAQDFKKGVLLAVNHGGDSDSTGSITGNILGASLGISAIGEEFLNEIELYDLILEMADDIFQLGDAQK